MIDAALRRDDAAAAVRDGGVFVGLRTPLAGGITTRGADIVPASESAEAHRRLEKGGLRGRLVLRF
ncbi:hypothetical protein P0W64_02720 [Tsukamurella sp. 8F]|uniref:hypothetical protein n=1 Tax=unclassified Tsukamurella TaxID=2633480 RepID=UPI0023B977F7|nr:MULTISPECIES: hypothetical protein [unclassified Tsukamurella]MDF0528720.1 hypothetical protein [Tsukamurella sp. 8J]MDF0585682.1 hypothetical protein [Tsukamurella sp. 8F]